MFAGVLLTALALSTGCEAVWNSVYRETNVEQGTSVVTDAKQRLITNVAFVEKADGSGRHTPRRIICAEPSPDVAQALSTALNASLSLDKLRPVPSGLTGEKSNSSDAALALATTASVAQLGERLAVIQLLRDKMYRACEAYANGAVNETGYVLMLARLDKTMATMLSTEMAAGAFGRSLALLGGAPASAGGVDPKRLGELEAAAKAKAERLEQLSKDIANETDEAKRKAKLADAATARKELDQAISAVAQYERFSAHAATGSGAGGSAPGQIAGQTRPTTTTEEKGADGKSTKTTTTTGDPAGSIVAIHRHFMDDDGLEPIADACLNRLSASTPVETITGRVTWMREQLRYLYYREPKDHPVGGGKNVAMVRLGDDFRRNFIAINMAIRGIGLDDYAPQTPAAGVRPRGASPIPGQRVGGASAAANSPSDLQFELIEYEIRGGGGYYDATTLDTDLKKVADKLSTARTSGGRDAFNYVCLKLFDDGGGDFVRRRLQSKLMARAASVPGSTAIDIGVLDMCASVTKLASRDRGRLEPGLQQSLNMCTQLLNRRAGAAGGVPRLANPMTPL